jgi:hypothetical protein
MSSEGGTAASGIGTWEGGSLEPSVATGGQGSPEAVVDGSRWRIAGAVSLVVSGIAMTAQYAVTPVHVANGTAQKQVEEAVGHGTRMQASVWLDLLILLVIPAALALGEVAGRSRLAVVGTALAFFGALPAGYLLALDVLVQKAVGAKDQAGAVALLDAYQHTAIVNVAVLLGVLILAVGFVLLGIALVREHAVPAWVGVAVAASAVLVLVGEAGNVFALALAAYLLRAAAFALCAVALLGTRQTQPRTLVNVAA